MWIRGRGGRQEGDGEADGAIGADGEEVFEDDWRAVGQETFFHSRRLYWPLLHPPTYHTHKWFANPLEFIRD